ncbi:MAG: sugar kinase [Clostridia bacterium]|nr:sugar kinase [Clostridia bacterium]
MKVVTFGEIMLRLAPFGYLRFLQEPSFQATFGGGEANVAVSLSNFGIDTKFVTKLPNNDIALGCVRELNKYGVDTSSISFGGDRMGIYFLEKGASMRGSKVIYDRKYSSISMAKKEDFDWDTILNDCTLFHFTGITPAISDSLAEITLEAVKTAKKKGITVSCDLNYRKKLWSKEKANKVMSSLMPYVDICIANEEDAQDVFNISANADLNAGKLDRGRYESVAKQLVDMFNFKKVAITLRESISANDNNWGAMIYSNGVANYSKTYSIRIVDRVGGGDSFGAGLIYSLLNNYSDKDAIEFAAAASALKQTIEGDFSLISVNEVESLVSGNIGGRVQR